MASLVQDNGKLRMVEAIDEGRLCMKSEIDLGKLCQKEAIDQGTLCTRFTNTLTQQGYRADTTVLTADNTSYTADYHV